MPATSAKAPVTIRMDLAQRDALDARSGRDRSHVVNEAVQAWPESERVNDDETDVGLIYA